MTNLRNKIISMVIIAIAITMAIVITTDIGIAMEINVDPDIGNIASGQTIRGDINPSGDTDSFTFYGKTGQIVVIEMAANNSDVGPKIDLYDPNNILETNFPGAYDAHRGRIENYKLKNTGIYTIVTAASWAGHTSATGTYGLSLVLIPGASSSKYDSDGGDIVSGDTYKGDIYPNGDTDIFIFYGKKGEGVVIEMAANNSDIGPQIYLYNSSGIETSFPGAYDAHRGRIENYILKNTGIYTIMTAASWAGHTSAIGKYDISFVKIPSTTHGIYNPNPSDKATVTDLEQTFRWNIEGNVATTYDVYFGEDIISPLKKVGNNISLREIRFSMIYGKTYYWHVEAKTSSGVVKGPYWWFNTKDITVSNCKPSIISGYKFNDINNNKTKDIGESGISDWVINLKGFDTCTKKLVDRTVRTNTTGYYRFNNVNSGVYITYENFLSNWLPTTSAAYTITVPSISTSIKRNFGNKR